MSKEQIAEQVVTQGIFNLPWSVVIPLGGAMGTLAYTCVRALFRITALEKHNDKQDKKLEKISDTANDTNLKVSKIVGYIDAKKEGTNA